ncbi:Superoxide-generating NADPH oxidase heavy chain subunit A [Smittium mucronatum]|uniref:Superoxide-generating NADPH oxidase heavy chain subunit A n=1 Tax=Smittium mucronatum TaxID=133383 RepID=A0A1R0H3Y1_9FUNG|nr:Superoxide-generating NADPH oxidase heavy chain subunit A [Smittium mucronatum]
MKLLLKKSPKFDEKSYALAPKKTIFSTISIWFEGNGKWSVFFGLWLLTLLVVLVLGAINYSTNEIWQAQKTRFGASFVISRTSALLIHVNVAVVMLPICRSLLTLLRSTRLSQILSFDLNIKFHKFVGWTIVVFSIIHALGHYRNYYILAYDSASDSGRSVAAQFFWLLLVSGPSWTGHIMLICLLLIAIPATDSSRKSNFNRFYYLHHLFAVFFLLFSIHGAFCLLKPSSPPYCTRGAAFYKYYLFTGFIYLVERVRRELRGTNLGRILYRESSDSNGKISKVILHPSRVIEIQMQKDPQVNFKSGQFIYLNCPAISNIEWHPFTLTSAPEEDFFSVHIRVVGDWTSSLASALGIDELSTEFEKIEQPVLQQLSRPNSYSKHHLDNRNSAKRNSNKYRKSLQLKLSNFVLPKLIIDGPFGCASEEVFSHEVAVLFGSGIGVTPFASILKSIWYRHNSPGNVSSLQKVYFIWTSKETESFEWFQDLLLAIEEEEILEFGALDSFNSPSQFSTSKNFIEFQIHLTKKFNSYQMGNVILNDMEGMQDVITNLKSPTFYGRPNLGSIFSTVAKRHPGADVGVFFCGPEGMGRDIEKTLYTWNKNYYFPGATKFSYKKENF